MPQLSTFRLVGIADSSGAKVTAYPHRKLSAKRHGRTEGSPSTESSSLSNDTAHWHRYGQPTLSPPSLQHTGYHEHLRARAISLRVLVEVGKRRYGLFNPTMPHTTSSASAMLERVLMRLYRAAPVFERGPSATEEIDIVAHRMLSEVGGSMREATAVVAQADKLRRTLPSGSTQRARSVEIEAWLRRMRRPGLPTDTPQGRLFTAIFRVHRLTPALEDATAIKSLAYAMKRLQGYTYSINETVVDALTRSVTSNASTAERLAAAAEASKLTVESTLMHGATAYATHQASKIVAAYIHQELAGFAKKIRST